MAFSSGLRVPTISAQRERERERQERVKDAGRAAEAGPEAHAGRIALALDWKPDPAPACVGASCRSFAEGKGRHPKGTDSFPNQIRVWDTAEALVGAGGILLALFDLSENIRRIHVLCDHLPPEHKPLIISLGSQNETQTPGLQCLPRRSLPPSPTSSSSAPQPFLGPAIDASGPLHLLPVYLEHSAAPAHRPLLASEDPSASHHAVCALSYSSHVCYFLCGPARCLSCPLGCKLHEGRGPA